MRDELRTKALQILKTARLVEGVRGRWGFVQWKDGPQAAQAFALFNQHAGRGFMSPNCMPCHSKVFNWLLEQATEYVEIEQLEIPVEDAGQ